MSLTDRLHDELERSFADEPPHRPVETQVAAGHRALRRRRTVGAAALAGVVAVLGTAYAVGSSGPDRDAGRIIASDPPSPSGSAGAAAWEDDTPIRYVSGQLEIRPGVVVHHRIENPYDYQAPQGSDAFDLTYEGERMWILADYRGSTFGYSSTSPSAGWASFRDWVDDQVAQDGGNDLHGYPRAVQLAADGRVVPVDGAEVFNRTDHPDLGARFAPPGATTGAAVVQPPGAPTAYFIVWRVIDGKLDVIYTRPRDVVGATFDELLTYARAQYAGGEGLR